MNKTKKLYCPRKPVQQRSHFSRRQFVQGASAFSGSSRHRLANNPLGFNGERQDPVTGLYSLGNGYRVYNPRLMRFHACDSMSPFGEGGVNSYAYCLGDPVNLRDPSGHFAILSLLVGVVIGAAVGAVISMAMEGIKSAITGAPIDWKQVGIGAALGALSGGFAATAQGVRTSMQFGLAITDTVVSGAADFGLNMAAGANSRDAAINAGIGAVIGLGTFGAVRGLGKLKRPVTYQKKEWERIQGENTITLVMHTEEISNSNYFFRGYTNNFRGLHQDAFLLHGSKDGRLVIGRFSSYGNVIPDTDKSLTPAMLVNFMKQAHGIDLRTGNGPIHLVSCYAKRGAAQSLANATRRPVIGYSKRMTASINLAFFENPDYPIYSTFHRWEFARLFGPYYQPSPRMFYPQ